jgi:tripartite-type tricarboxylate transporter receptor subunit TctC
MQRRHFIAATASSVATPALFAQAWPAKPLSWLVPFAAGGPTDALARNIAERVGRELNQTILIENLAGAGGTVGAARVAKAANDGYSFLVGHMGVMGAAPALYKKLPYDPSKDFEAVFRFPDTPLVLLVNPNSPYKTIQDFVKFAKTNPKKINLGNAGVGSSSHLIAALFASSVGIQITSVPYRGAGPALNDVMGGQIDGMFDQTNTALPQVQGGKVRAIAVTSMTRIPQFKDVPTVHETVTVGFEASTWYGIYAPKGTPKPVLDGLYRAYTSAMKDKAFTQKMADQGIQLLPAERYSPSAFAQLTEREVTRWRAVVARAGIEAQG